MLVNATPRALTQCEQTLELMDNSDFRFVLTGSRFFNPGGITQDYDFFTVNDAGVREWLIRHDFKVLSRYLMESGYGSVTGQSAVFRKNHNDGSPWVDVQLVDNFASKVKANDTINRLAGFLRFNTASKGERRNIWEALLKENT